MFGLRKSVFVGLLLVLLGGLWIVLRVLNVPIPLIRPELLLGASVLIVLLLTLMGDCHGFARLWGRRVLTGVLAVGLVLFAVLIFIGGRYLGQDFTAATGIHFPKEWAGWLIGLLKNIDINVLNWIDDQVLSFLMVLVGATLPLLVDFGVWSKPFLGQASKFAVGVMEDLKQAFLDETLPARAIAYGATIFLAGFQAIQVAIGDVGSEIGALRNEVREVRGESSGGLSQLAATLKDGLSVTLESQNIVLNSLQAQIEEANKQLALTNARVRQLAAQTPDSAVLTEIVSQEVDKRFAGKPILVEVVNPPEPDPIERCLVGYLSVIGLSMSDSYSDMARTQTFMLALEDKREQKDLIKRVGTFLFGGGGVSQEWKQSESGSSPVKTKLLNWDTTGTDNMALSHIVKQACGPVIGTFEHEGPRTVQVSDRLGRASP